MRSLRRLRFGCRDYSTLGKAKHCLRSVITPVHQINFTSSVWIIAAIRDHFFYSPTHHQTHSTHSHPLGAAEKVDAEKEYLFNIRSWGGERNVDLSPLPISYDQPTDNDGAEMFVQSSSSQSEEEIAEHHFIDWLRVVLGRARVKINSKHGLVSVSVKNNFPPSPVRPFF